jgi:hypothetical protein
VYNVVIMSLSPKRKKTTEEKMSARGLIRTVGSGAIHPSEPPKTMEFDGEIFQLDNWNYTSSTRIDAHERATKLANRSFDIKMYSYFEHPDFTDRYDKRWAIYKRKKKQKK